MADAAPQDAGTAWLYAASLCLFATAAVGRVIATDTGQLDTWIRGGDLESAA